ncbi:MAG: transposase [Peptostreptococcus porci]|uniref:transposase n=1 Tax=Peptostreptococcus porci TaxID=2652282 RepID=UPI002A909D23|nr:transposase [Peptostreptococcus porci]MDY5480650.1 transposase [Peptostreptococcus porci]
MNNNIIEIILNKDKNTNYQCDFDKINNEYIITVEKAVTPKYCPVCNTKMYSKGIRTRRVRHPILNNGKTILIHLKQRSWVCTNEMCKHRTTDEFSFVEKYKQTTNMTDLMILNELRDLNLTAKQVAKRFKVSDTHVYNIFDKYVNIERFPLTNVISIDEVFTNFDNDRKYSLVIMDFMTNKPIDLIESRRNKYTDEYFSSIDIEERANVEYLICDMYKPYFNYVKKYFINAKLVVDSFHVIQWLILKIDTYLKGLYRKYNYIYQDRLFELKKYNPDAKLRISDEMYLLKFCKWLILSNSSSINYSAKHKYNHHFKIHVDTYFLEKKFFEINDILPSIKKLKEKYIDFNSKKYDDLSEVESKLDYLIEVYKLSEINIFIEFAALLERYKENIINSFVVIEKINSNGVVYKSRLSNGPIEATNRKIKDLKRHSRGFNSFTHIRNRFLFSENENSTIRNCPLKMKDIRRPPGKKRGKYKRRSI